MCFLKRVIQEECSVFEFVSPIIYNFLKRLEEISQIKILNQNL